MRHEHNSLLPFGLLRATLVVAMLFLTAATVARQDASATIEPPAEIDVQGLDARMAALENDAQAGELPSEARQELDSLSGTRQFLDAGSASLARAETYARERQVAQETDSIDTYLATPMDELVASVDDTLQLDELNAQFEAAKVQLESEQELRSKVDADDVARRARRTEITQDRSESTSRLDSLVAELEAGAGAGDSETLATAKRWNALAEQYRHLARLRELDEEVRLADARNSLLEKSRSFRDRRVTVASRHVRALQDAITQLQLESARAVERELEKQRREAATAHPLVRSILDTNGEYAKRHTEILDEAAQVETIDADIQTWRRRFERSRTRVERVGLTNAIGRHLHRQRKQLPDARVVERQKAGSQAVIGQLVDEVGDLEVVRDELEDVEDAVELMLAGSTSLLPTDTEELGELRLAVSGALLQQRELATTLSVAINKYVDETLLGVQNQRRELHELLEAYADFIDERVMWIRSAEPIGRSDPGAAGASVAGLFDRNEWKEVAARVWHDLGANTGSYVLCALLLVFLLVIRPSLKRWLRAIADKTRRFTTDGFHLTAGALGISVLLAATGPLIVTGAAWRLGVASVEYEFGAALSAGLFQAASLLLLLEFVRVLCRPNGLGDAHFRWDQASLGIVRRNIRWLTPIVVPLTFVAGVAAVDDQDAALMRFAFIATMVAYSYFLMRLLKPTAPIVRSFLVDRQGGWIDRLKYVWYPLIVLVPIAIAIAAVLGYVYSAVHLAERAADTAWLLLLIFAGHSLLLRCLFLAQRRLSIEQRRKKLAAEAAARAEQEAAIPLPGEVGTDDEEAEHERPQSVPGSEEIDVAALSTQTRQLLGTAVIFSMVIGLAVVWANMLPALGYFQEIVVWPPGGASAEVSTTGAVPMPAGAPAGVATTGSVLTDTITGSGDVAAPVATSQAVTIGNLLASLVIMVITVLVSRNLPGLLEIVLLQRLPISPGGRYAITTIAQYVLVIVGFVLAFGAVGIGWSKVQWLAAAITVGLGFGLQEIFANFVSGLIILFERPVRVGDTITVGGVSGRVARLRIRATTIVDWDRKELIIPNKEFVTGQIINWTLTEQTLRIVIPVGIAYGSDKKLAERTLLEIAHDDPDVLDDPAPSVVFSEFGDSALTFNLRVFIPHIDHLIEVRHRLHIAIDDAFCDAGIVIAFPQRDVHVIQPPATTDGADGD